VTTGGSILLVGFDPKTIPGVDAQMIETAVAIGEERLREGGYVTEYCLVAPDEHATDLVLKAVSSKPFDCVVVGGGIRKPEEHLELFEQIVNLVRIGAPGAAIAFNTNPTDSVDAVRRWID
jgi:heptaprenylglyceryl phosphate synthase